MQNNNKPEIEYTFINANFYAKENKKENTSKLRGHTSTYCCHWQIEHCIINCVKYANMPKRYKYNSQSTWHIRRIVGQEYVLWNAVSVPLLQRARYCSIVQTLSLKYPGRDLDLEVTWRRWSPDHTIRYVQFPIRALSELTQIWSPYTA